MRRDGSRNSLFVQRIPADIRDKVVGDPLAIPLGEGFAFVTPSPSAQSIRFSLRTSDPTETKTRQAIAAAFLESVWAALRNDVLMKLSHKQATVGRERIAGLFAFGISDDRTYISQVERGKQNVTVIVLARIEGALKTTPDKPLIAPRKARS